jgi:hypothetical protein
MWQATPSQSGYQILGKEMNEWVVCLQQWKKLDQPLPRYLPLHLNVVIAGLLARFPRRPERHPQEPFLPWHLKM